MLKLTIFVTVSLLVGHALSDCVTTTSEDETLQECARGCKCPSKYSSCSLRLTWSGKVSNKRAENNLCECKTCAGDRDPNERPPNGGGGGGGGGRPVYRCTKETIDNMSEYRCSRYCVCEDGQTCRGQYRWSSDGRGGSRCECELCRRVARTRKPTVTALEHR